jgi:4-amino-4-deoxy-L-arabinose transferase-like glycosyltransferase
MLTAMSGAPVRRVHLWILLIVLLAFGLRLYAIDRQDIWGDEAFSIWLSSQPLPEVVAGGADTHPPLYPVLLYLWLRLAGSSPLAVRLLSAFIGTLAIPVVYVLGTVEIRD